MKRGYDKFFVRKCAGEIVGYVYLNTANTTPDRFGNPYYQDCVEFLEGHRKRKDYHLHYPVIYKGDPDHDLEEIVFEDIPAPIKRRYTKWENLQ